jgi:putative AlgH/UPF0301 family transcriptional regulator
VSGLHSPIAAWASIARVHTLRTLASTKRAWGSFCSRLQMRKGVLSLSSARWRPGQLR